MRKQTLEIFKGLCEFSKTSVTTCKSTTVGRVLPWNQVEGVTLMKLKRVPLVGNLYHRKLEMGISHIPNHADYKRLQFCMEDEHTHSHTEFHRSLFSV